MHLGHKFCIEKACEMCDEVHVILFDSPENRHLETGTEIDSELSIAKRLQQVNSVVSDLEKKFQFNKDIFVHYINTDECVFEDGSENWDAETPLVLNAIGKKFQYVFSSEPSYDEYFKRAYPWAKHILVDPPREIYPISATAIRDGGKEMFKKWGI